MKMSTTSLEKHYYIHAPRGFGADPQDCVACKHEHPDLEKKIANLSSRITQYSFYGLGFIVAANLISEWAKKRFIK